MKKLLITGSNGLIGSAAVQHFDQLNWSVYGLDNNQRKIFFGDAGDTSSTGQWLQQNTSDYHALDVDIRNREALLELFRLHRFDATIHCAAQPSHDLAAKIPFDDFDINAVGTLNLLEACRQHCPDSPFVLMSTNKVYGDAPNEKLLTETPTRFDYLLPEDYYGIDEHCRIDNCLHSLFGVSKLAGDVLAQEYGKYFHLPVGIFRGGCLTGPRHKGVPLHGFLSHLVKTAVQEQAYTVYGYSGKQVRDNVDAADVVQAFDLFIQEPHCGEVYNLGGGRENNISVVEAIHKLNELTGKQLKWNYEPEHRRGDHICYISDTRKLQRHYPSWKPTKNIDQILKEMVDFELASPG